MKKMQPTATIGDVKPRRVLDPPIIPTSGEVAEERMKERGIRTAMKKAAAHYAKRARKAVKLTKGRRRALKKED